MRAGMTSPARLLDQAVAQAHALREEHDGLIAIGYGYWELFDEHGHLKEAHPFANLITQVGDQFYGDRAAQIASGAKTLTAITNATTAVCTTSAAHGFGVGDVVTIAGVTPAGYNGSWAIVAVGSTTTFSIYVGTALGAGSAADTIARAVDTVSPVNKGASDTLDITWNHDLLGA